MDSIEQTSNEIDIDGVIQYISMSTDDPLPNNEREVHAHYNKFEIYYFLEGDLYFAFEGKRFDIKEKTMIIIANGTLHRPIVKSTCRYYRKRILFDKEIFTGFNTTNFELYTLLRKKKFLIFDKNAVESLQLDVLFNEIESSLFKKTPYDDFCALISLFSLLIKAEKNAQDCYNTSLSRSSSKADEIIKFINEHLSENLSYKYLANHFFISEKNLYKFFKKETGFTLSDYISERRIIKAQSLMNAGISANEAAEKSGFNDYSVFYRNFTRKTGITPSEYIKQANLSI